MSKLIYILLCILLAFPVRLSAQDDLNGYLEIAAENNPGLKGIFNEYMAALEKIPQLGTLPDPVIAFGYFIRPVETRLGPQQTRISVSQMFPWFGTLDARENSAESLAKVKYESFEEAKSKLFYEVKSTYYNLFFIHKAIDITKQNINILESFKNLIAIKIESGSASSLDAYRVEMELNDLENQLALLKDEQGSLRVKFVSHLNVDENTELVIPGKLPAFPISQSKEQIRQDILANNNVLSAFDYQVEGLQHREKLASKEGLPRFSIGLDYTFIGEGENSSANAGQDAFMFPKVGIVVPLYRKKYKAMVQEIIYLQEAKTYEKSEKENAIIVLFEEIWKDHLDAERRTILYDEQALLAKKSLTILESNYTTGDLSFEEILTMERKLLKYSLELQKAIADKEAAIAFIHYLQGQ